MWYFYILFQRKNKLTDYGIFIFIVIMPTMKTSQFWILWNVQNATIYLLLLIAQKNLPFLSVGRLGHCHHIHESSSIEQISRLCKISKNANQGNGYAEATKLAGVQRTYWIADLIPCKAPPLSCCCYLVVTNRLRLLFSMICRGIYNFVF
jgi:hypothetical protein